MGKWTVQATDEVLLAKIRTAVQDAIETHRNEKHQEGEARPVSFTEFVEELDAKDAFTARLMEILVKEYSERRAKATPVERRLQIASRTSKALGAIPRDATVYDNSRPGRWPRTRYPSSFRRHVMDEDDAFGTASRGDEDLILPNVALPTSTRDRLFQNALEELEDGEFGAHWNSNLNEVYADEGNPARWQRSETIRPILHDVDMGGWHLSTERDDLGLGAVRSTSPSSFESEMDSLAQSQEALSRLRARVGTLSDSLGHRLGSPRLPLVRRHSLRRSRFGRSSSTIDLDVGLRRRLARTEGEGGDSVLDQLGEDYLSRTPLWRPSSRRTGDLADGPETFRSQTTSSGSALRRLWAEYPVGTTSSIASGSNTTLQGRRGLRRGGLLPPETFGNDNLAPPGGSPYPPTLRPPPVPNPNSNPLTNLNRTLPVPNLRFSAFPLASSADFGETWSNDLRSPRPGIRTYWDSTAEENGENARTAPPSPIPGDPSNIRVRWTEDLVSFPVTSDAAEHESASAFPELALPAAIGPSLSEGAIVSSTLPEPGTST